MPKGQYERSEEQKEALRRNAKKASAASAEYWRGRSRSEEQKAAHSALMRGRPAHNKGVPPSSEQLEKMKKHGHASDKGKLSPTYISWRNMKQRCGNPNKDSYHHYGGRGITVCERWVGVQGFTNFLADMGERPDGMTLDRVDPDEGYSPENCQWATRRQQSRNIRKARLSDEAVAWIRAHSEVSQRRAAEKFGVSKAVIADVRHHKGRYEEL